jgi:hypothetical protein
MRGSKEEPVAADPCAGGRDAIHVLFAVDVPGDNVRVITAYGPSADEWNDDLKTRRGA